MQQKVLDRLDGSHNGQMISWHRSLWWQLLSLLMAADACGRDMHSNYPVARPNSCVLTDACRNDGRCDLGDDGNCSAARDADCWRSEGCWTAGRCKVRAGHCVASSALECQNSSNCRTAGACVLAGESCIIAQSKDCATSEACSLQGLCSIAQIDGRSICAALRNEDCDNAMICTHYAACSAKNGECIVAGGDPSQAR
jgi:hypothetical protein